MDGSCGQRNPFQEVPVPLDVQLATAGLCVTQKHLLCCVAEHSELLIETQPLLWQTCIRCRIPFTSTSGGKGRAACFPQKPGSPAFTLTEREKHPPDSAGQHPHGAGEYCIPVSRLFAVTHGGEEGGWCTARGWRTCSGKAGGVVADPQHLPRRRGAETRHGAAPWTGSRQACSDASWRRKSQLSCSEVELALLGCVVHDCFCSPPREKRERE